MYINVMSRSASVEGQNYGTNPGEIREVNIFSTVEDHTRIVLYDGKLGARSPAFTVGELRALAAQKNAAHPARELVDNAAHPDQESPGAAEAPHA